MKNPCDRHNDHTSYFVLAVDVQAVYCRGSIFQYAIKARIHMLFNCTIKLHETEAIYMPIVVRCSILVVCVGFEEAEATDIDQYVNQQHRFSLQKGAKAKNAQRKGKGRATKETEGNHGERAGEMER
jgi:hypothetical protein